MRGSTSLEEVMFPRPVSKKKGSGLVVGFPEVCKVPAPPAPFVPAPYPNIALQENLKKANAADAKAKTGNKEAQADVEKAVENLAKAMGDEAGTLKGMTATKAVMVGFNIHHSGAGKPTPGRQNSIARTSTASKKL
jgi:hypothetical protein